MTKYLVADELNYYTVENGVLKSVAIIEPLTAEQMQKYGCNEVPNGSLLVPLYDSRVYMWTDTSENVTIKSIATAIVGEHILTTNNMDLTDQTIKGIRNAVCDVSGSALISMSWDDGMSWEYYDGTNWVVLNGTYANTTVDEEGRALSSGMTAETLSAITTSQWESYYNSKSSKQCKFRFILSQADVLRAVKINFVNYGKLEA